MLDAAPDFFNSARWPYLPVAKDDADFRDCVLTVMRTEAGQKLMNTMVMKFLLEDGEEGISAERLLGRQDMAKWLFRQYNIALYAREVSDG